MIAVPGPDIGQSTSAALQTGIDLPLRQVRLPAGSVDGPGALEGRVGISGAWQGEAVIRCGVGLARRVAGAIYAVPPQQVRVEQIQSAVVRLASLTASGLETMLPQPCRLARPRVRAACDADAQRLGGAIRSEVHFDCEGEPLVILLVERSADH
jgi:hypothetical protein